LKVQPFRRLRKGLYSSRRILEMCSVRLEPVLDEAKTSKKRGLDTGARVYLSDCSPFVVNNI
jgi:hypothetical protein